MKVRNKSERTRAGQISQDAARRLLEAAESVVTLYRNKPTLSPLHDLEARWNALEAAIEEIRLGE